MKVFFDWFAERGFRDGPPWLILGKGPSYARRGELDLAAYKTLSLNHVVREGPVDVAHAIDLDVVVDCAAAIERHAAVLVMPWIPHVRMKPGDRDLDALAREVPVLARLASEGRLLGYDLSTAPARHGGGPVVEARYFSAEAALSLLAQAGARRVRSLGVDGGTAYSAAFDDLAGTTRLANSHTTFDLQFRGIAGTILKTGVDYAPLTVPSPVKVFVGSEPAQSLSVKVLEYSIKKHASLTTEVVPLYEAGIEVPMPRDPANRPRTPFSFQRFFIPELCRFTGRAIYVDSDMQVFRDIRELWTIPFDGADLLAAAEPGSSGRKPQFSVMLLDCESLAWDVRELVRRLDAGELTYATLMYEMKAARSIRAGIDPSWNSLEQYEEGTTGLLHYTDMPTQPWLSRDNPRAYLWVRDLIESVTAGFLTREVVAAAVEAGHVRPSLLWQLDHGLDECDLLPRAARELDRAFVPPHEVAGLGGGSGGLRPLRVLRAAWRRLYRMSPLPRIEARLKGPRA
jgi:hypothetical protein